MEDEGDGSDDGRLFYLYTGDGEIPRDVTHVRVDQSVTVINGGAFEHCYKLVEVELPDGLLEIGHWAFFWCNSLVRIAIPSTVIEIGVRAFQNCEKLEEISLPNGLERLRSLAFFDCRSLRRINIPPTIKGIEDYTFYNCENLVEATLSEGIRKIGQGAFNGCTSLNSVHLPSSLAVIGPQAFKHCTGLAEIIIPAGVNAIGWAAFGHCSFQNFQIPPAMTKVNMSMFNHCDCMVSLEIPNTANLIEGCVSDSLRNVAMPEGCQVGDVKMNECGDLRNLFPDEHSMASALQHRFDGLPIHEICYYRSYHPTESVMSALRREINSWTSKFPGTLNATGKQKDCLGMTPLHILACSTKHDLGMVQLLVQKYPETLVLADKWGGTPLLYAFWCNAPNEIIQFLVESLKSLFPYHELDWHGMIVTLVQARLPVRNIQSLLNVQQGSFSGQNFDLQAVVVELAEFDSSQTPFEAHYAFTLVESLRFLIQESVSDRLDLLDVRRWREEIEKMISDLPDIRKREMRKQASLREEQTRALYTKLAGYELLKEATTLLELAVWKAKIDESISTRCQNRQQKKARVGDANKEECRINCRADVVIRNVLPYLCLA